MQTLSVNGDGSISVLIPATPEQSTPLDFATTQTQLTAAINYLNAFVDTNLALATDANIVAVQQSLTAIQVLFTNVQNLINGQQKNT